MTDVDTGREAAASGICRRRRIPQAGIRCCRFPPCGERQEAA
jgi:hypothetical protein